MAISLASAYEYCEQFARSHHEFFPVASWFLPKPLRKNMSVIYTFCRTADDLADEGVFSKDERVEKLEALATTLEHPNTPLSVAVTHLILTENLSKTLFLDLIQAFKQDANQNRYHTTAEVLKYCRYSANPVGRLLLQLTHQDNEKNLHYSDAICTALQLINFIRDIHDDLAKRDRCYLPLEEMARMGLSIEDLQKQRLSPELFSFLKQKMDEAQDWLNHGKPLGQTLTGIFGLEIRLIIAHNQAMLDKLRQRKNPYHPIKLTGFDWMKRFITNA